MTAAPGDFSGAAGGFALTFPFGMHTMGLSRGNPRLDDKFEVKTT